MSFEFPQIIIASRWIYAFHAIAALPVLLALSIPTTLFFVELGSLQSFSTILMGLGFLLLPLAALTWFFTSCTRLIFPPMLQLTRGGMLYKTAFETRQWQWSSIRELKLVMGGKTKRSNRGVSFSWTETEGTESQSIVLDAPFKGNFAGHEPLLQLLQKAQKEAIGNTQPQPLSHVKIGSLSRKLNGGILGTLWFVFCIAITIIFANSKTELVVPENISRIEFIENIFNILTMCIFGYILFAFESTRDTIISTSRKIITWGLGLFFCVLFSIATFGMLANNIDESIAFSDASEPYRSVQWKVEYLSSGGKGGPNARLAGPEDSSPYAPISRDEFARFGGIRNIEDRNLCYTVLQQKNGRAIRILRPEKPKKNELRLKHCA
jgi:hypothetical protein